MKEEIKKAVEFLSPIVEKIISVDISRHIVHYTIKQNLKRGQGKRVSGMVVGAGTTCYGSKIIIGYNLLEFKDDLSNEQKLSLQSNNTLHLFLLARNYGLNSKMSFFFAKLYYFGRLGQIDIIR